MIKTLVRNLSLFNNFQTVLVTFIVEPFFNVLFFYLISPYTHANADKLILTAVILTATYKIIGIYSQIFVYAQSIDILKEIFIDLRGFLKFNRSVLFISISVASLQSFILLTIYKVLRFDIQISFKNASIIILLVVVFSSLFAMLSSISSLQKNNPYFYSNLLIGVLPVVSATIVSISTYPTWLAVISRILPFWAIQNLIWENQAQFPLIALYFVLSCSLLVLIVYVKRRKILLA